MAEYARPPVSFRFTCSGLRRFHAGKAVAASPLLPVPLTPLAIEAEIEGLFCVMKLPQMVMKALLKSGPWLGVGGPK